MKSLLISVVIECCKNKCDDGNFEQNKIKRLTEGILADKKKKRDRNFLEIKHYRGY